MNLRRYLLPLFVTLLLSGAGPALGQNNPAIEACGLPSLRAFIRETVTYTLRSDCLQAGSLIVPGNTTVTINGNGHRIRAGAGGFILINGTPQATINLNEVTLDGASLAREWLVSISGTLNAAEVIFTGAREGAALRAAGEARVTLNEVVFTTNQGQGDLGSALHILGQSEVKMSNARFRHNRGGAGVVVLRDEGTLWAGGCLELEDNIPADIVGRWTDESGVCTPPAEPETWPLGALGVVYRYLEPELALDIYGVAEDSSGYFLLRVTHEQVQARQPGELVATTQDGRVAVHIEPDGHITISMGPGPEGKVHHITLKDNLGGSVISTVDTIGGPPGAAGN